MHMCAAGQVPIEQLVTRDCFCWCTTMSKARTHSFKEISNSQVPQGQRNRQPAGSLVDAQVCVARDTEFRGWAAVTWKCHSALQAWTPGVAWSVTWCYLECYLECYLVLPGRCLAIPGFLFWIRLFFGGLKISAFLKLKPLEKDQFPPRDVTWAHACSRYLFTWPTL